MNNNQSTNPTVEEDTQVAAPPMMMKMKMTEPIAMAPSGTMIASIRPLTSSSNNNSSTGTTGNHINDDDTMVMLTIQSISLLPNNKSSISSLPLPPPVAQTIRIPSISSYMAMSSSSTTKVPNQYSVQRRQLIWLGDSSTGSSISTASHSDTPFIGLVTTLLESSSSSKSLSTTTTTTLLLPSPRTFLTVIDRTRGIPIYTIQCNHIHINDHENDDTTTPILIHDATTTSSSLSLSTIVSKHQRSPRPTLNSSSNTPTTGGTTCIGIYQCQPSSSSSSFYIAIARTTTTTTTDVSHRSSTGSCNDEMSRIKVPVLLYECQISNGKILRKIKLGHYYQYNSNDNNVSISNSDIMMGTSGRDDTYQPWLSILNVHSSSSSHTTIPSTTVVTYVLGNGRTSTSSSSSGDGNKNDDSGVLILRGMNMMDGSKLYKMKLSSHLSTMVLQSSTYVSSLSSSISVTVLFDSNGVVQLFDTMTGNRIVSHQQQQQISKGNHDDTIVVSDHIRNNSDHDNYHHHYSSKMRLQVVITEIPPNDAAIATPTKKTKKSKGSTTPQISQYCVWILINETTLLPILLRLKENVATPNNAITTSDYGYAVQPQYRIVSANISEDDTMTMRCSFLHHHHQHSTNTNTQMKHPSQPPQLMAYQQSCLTSQALNAINVQTVPLSLNMDVGKDNVIKIQVDDKHNINKEQDNGMMIDDPDTHLEDDMDHEELDGDDVLGSNTTSDTAKKRKAPLTTVLGPGQSGGEARHVTEANDENRSTKNKRMKQASDDNEDDDHDDNADDHEPTIAERLRLLQQALDAEDDDDDNDDDDEPMDETMDDHGEKQNDKSHRSKNESKFVVKHATTESLTQLLLQALQSSDGSMLEQALQVRDKDILRTTCQALSSEQVLVLFDALIQRLASKPNRAEQLVAWVSAILQSNQITNVQHLQPLQNLLSERLEVFPLLLQLEGRLENMIGL